MKCCIWKGGVWGFLKIVGVLYENEEGRGGLACKKEGKFKEGMS